MVRANSAYVLDLETTIFRPVELQIDLGIRPLYAIIGCRLCTTEPSYVHYTRCRACRLKPDKSDMPLTVEADKGHFDSVERNICAAAAAAGMMQTAQSGSIAPVLTAKIGYTAQTLING